MGWAPFFSSFSFSFPLCLDSFSFLAAPAWIDVVVGAAVWGIGGMGWAHRCRLGSLASSESHGQIGLLWLCVGCHGDVDLVIGKGN